MSEHQATSDTTNFEGATSVKDEAKSVVGSIASDLQAAASRTFDDTVTELKSQATDARAKVAGGVNDVALALRRAAEDMRGGSAQERTLGMIADGIADASDAIRDKDLGEMTQMAGRIARQNPVLFLGGAAVLGFAISRFAKASAAMAGSSGGHNDEKSHGSGQSSRSLHRDSNLGAEDFDRAAHEGVMP